MTLSCLNGGVPPAAVSAPASFPGARSGHPRKGWPSRRASWAGLLALGALLGLAAEAQTQSAPSAPANLAAATCSGAPSSRS